MNYVRDSLAASLALLCTGALLGGCIITSADDSASTDGGDDGGPGAGPGGQTSAPDDGVDDDIPDGSDDDPPGDTGEPPGPCGENLLADPGFEEGTPSTAWSEVSGVFPTPICDGSCTMDPGADPFEGDWWVWFGGVEEPELASVSQTFATTGDSAELQFFFSINASAGSGDDIFAVHIDDDLVFMATDAEMEDYDGYTAVTVDITAYADGADHLLAFSGDLTGAGLTNFFLDSIAVSLCSGGNDTGTGSDSGGTTVVVDGTSTDGGSTDAGSSSGSSSDGGSSSSSTGGAT